MGLKRVFFHFFVQLMLSFAGVVIVWAASIFFLTATGIVEPANAVERQVMQWLAECEDKDAISLEGIPERTTYALFENSELLSTDMNEERLETAEELALSAEMTERTQINTNFTEVYRKQVIARQTLIVWYDLRAGFRSPLLARICPNAEVFLIVLLLCMLLLDTVGLILYHARRLEKELTVLQDAAAQIKDRNLDFTIEPVRIKEFNRVLDSLALLKTELQASFLNNWSLEQQQGRQMSALAHDIKTPLTILRGNAELLGESELNEEQREYVNCILDNTEQIQRYAAQIVEVSQRKTLSYSTKEQCGLSELLSNLETDYGAMGKDKNLHLQIEKEPGLPENIYTNEEGLKRVLWNILDNAVFYSPESGTITVNVFMKNGEDGERFLTFEILDEGEGFSEEALKYAVTEFYRADKSRGGKEHFGLGLAIAKQIAAQLGGGIEIANAPWGGACVTVWIK